MDAEQRAWVAGFLEGEGSFMLLDRPGHRPLARISAQSTDLDVIERVQSFTGMGVLVKLRDRPGRKPCWDWKVQRHDDARALMAELLPLMGERRQERIRAVLAGTTELAVPHCERGHDVHDPANVFQRQGRAICRACNAETLAAARAAKAA